MQMEPKEVLNSSGVQAAVPQNPTIETSVPVPAAVEVVPPPISVPSPVSMAVPTPITSPGTGNGMSTGEVAKKRRGRPRKYPAANGAGPSQTTLSPMPISASLPIPGPREFPSWKPARDKPFFNNFIKQSSTRIDYEMPVERINNFVGANFTAHVLPVHPGEDISLKIMSFSQQNSRGICILSATGTISNVTLRQASSCGGTLTYEGRFEILSLTGSYMPTDCGGTKSRSGGMSVSLAGPDGRVIGGGLAGLLIAGGPVQVVIGSFILGHQHEQMPKKLRMETPSVIMTPSVITSSTVVTTPTVNVISANDLRVSYGGIRPCLFPERSASPNTLPPGFPNSAVDNKTGSQTQDSREVSQSNGEASS